MFSSCHGYSLVGYQVDQTRTEDHEFCRTDPIWIKEQFPGTTWSNESRIERRGNVEVFDDVRRSRGVRNIGCGDRRSGVLVVCLAIVRTNDREVVVDYRSTRFVVRDDPRLKQRQEVVREAVRPDVRLLADTINTRASPTGVRDAKSGLTSGVVGRPRDEVVPYLRLADVAIARWERRRDRACDCTGVLNASKGVRGVSVSDHALTCESRTFVVPTVLVYTYYEVLSRSRMRVSIGFFKPRAVVAHEHAKRYRTSHRCGELRSGNLINKDICHVVISLQGFLTTLLTLLRP